MKKLYFIFFGLALCLCIYFFFFPTVLLKISFGEKIWVHRTNSIEKLNEVKNKFFGVELDVEYVDTTNIFDVNHPPAKSIGLSLFQYLNSCKENKNLHFWLDYKNLNANNKQKSLIRLLSICSNLKINPSNIIVENGDLSLLRDFQQKGFLVSYYLNWPGLFTLPDEEFDTELKKISTNIEMNKFPFYISSDYRDYKILKKYFPNNSKLLWLDGQFLKNLSFSNRLELLEMLKDENVKVVLFKYKSSFEER